MSTQNVSANAFSFENGSFVIKPELIPAFPNVIMVPTRAIERVPGFNGRDLSQYAVQSLREQMLADLGVKTSPLLLSLKNPDNNHRFHWLKTICGHRRGETYLSILNDPSISEEIKKHFEYLPCQVKCGMSYTQEVNEMYDQGGVRTFGKYETAIAVYRLRMELMLTYEQIGIKLQGLLAKNFGNESKLVMIPSNPREAEKYFKSWFRGTVDQYLLLAMKLGPVVWEQFLLSCKSADGFKDAKGERIKPEVNVLKRSLIQDLYKKRGEDEEAGEWDEVETGPRFQAAWQKLKDIEAGTAKAEVVQKVMSKKDLIERSKSARSRVTKAALLWASGDADAGPEMLREDEELLKVNQVLNRLAEARDCFKSPIRELVEGILSGSVATLETVLFNMGAVKPATPPVETATTPVETATPPVEPATPPVEPATPPVEPGKGKGKGKR